MATCCCMCRCRCSTSVVLALCLIEILLGIIELLLGVLNVFTSHGIFWFELRFGYIDLWSGPLVVLAGILCGCYLISSFRNKEIREHRSCCTVNKWLRCYLCFVLLMGIGQLVFACLVVIKYKQAKEEKTEIRFAEQYESNVPACFMEDCELRITLGYGFIIFASLQIIVTLCLLYFKLQIKTNEEISEDVDKSPDTKATIVEDVRVNGKIMFRSPRLNRYVYGQEHLGSYRHYGYQDNDMDLGSKEKENNGHITYQTDCDDNGILYSENTHVPQEPWHHGSVGPPLAPLEDIELGMSDTESPEDEPFPPPPSPYYQYVEPEEDIWIPRKLNAYVV